jgi:PAS domain S-box-containing protein
MQIIKPLSFNTKMPFYLQCTLLCVIYFLSLQLGLLLSFPSNSYSSFWPPIGILISFLLLSNKSKWLWLILSACIGSIIYTIVNHNALSAGILLFTSTALAAYMGSWIVRRNAGYAINLARNRHIVSFIIGAIIIAPLINALLVAGIKSVVSHQKEFTHIFLHVLSSGAFGVLLVSPIFSFFVTFRHQQATVAAPFKEYLLISVLFACTLFLSITTFTPSVYGPFNNNMLVVPVLFLAGILLNPFWSSIICLCSVIIAVYGTSHGLGKFAHESTSELECIVKLIVFQSFAILASSVVPISLMLRRNAEVRIKESEERFRTVFDESTLGMVIKSLDHEVLQVNSMFCAITGYTRKELIAMRFDTFTHPDDIALEKARLEQLIAETITNFQIQKRYIKKDKSIAWVLLTVSMLRDQWGKPQHFLGQIQDITERVIAENNLCTSELRFRNLFETMTEGVALQELVFNNLGKPTDYILSDFNPAYTKQTGISRDKALGKKATEAYSQTAAPYLDTYARVALTGQAENFETYFASLKKHFRVSAFSLGHNNFATVFEDITKRVDAIEHLKESEEQLRFLIHTIQTAILLYDNNGTIVSYNAKALELLEIPGEKLMGHRLHDFGIMFLNPDKTYLPKTMSLVENVINSGKPIFDKELGILFPQWRNPKWIFFNIAPIYAADGVIRQVLISCVDITEKQKAEESLRNSRNIESLGVLAGGIAHDFNNLLGGMFGYVDIARECIKNDKPEKAEEYLSKSLTVLTQTQALTHKLLTFSKGGTPVKKTMSVGTLLKSTTHIFLDGSIITPVFDIQNDLWPCDVDKNQLKQVLENIIRNARDEMPSGGTITITAHNIPAGSNVPVSLNPGAYIVITIADTGPGIAQENLARVFEPYFTTKQNSTGLGLSTAYSIVLRHNGYVTVESQQGKGALFSLFLPANTNAIVNDIQPNQTSCKGQRRILVMDDEAYMQDVAVAMLKTLGYESVFTVNGTDAITAFSIAQGTDMPFAAALLDLKVHEGMGGKDAVSFLREINPSCKLVASSGYFADPVMAYPQQYGFVDKLPKPYTITDLSDLFQRIGV